MRRKDLDRQVKLYKKKFGISDAKRNVVGEWCQGGG